MLESISLYAWGPMGHDVVAAIAENNLTKKAKKNLEKLLDGKSIVYYASWMDNIQNSPYWKDGYNKTKTWHYANVDKGLTYETMKKEPKGDVITGLEQLTDALKNHYTELTDSMRVDYVKLAFLVLSLATTSVTLETVWRIVMDFRSKSILSHCRPSNSLLRSP